MPLLLSGHSQIWSYQLWLLLFATSHYFYPCIHHSPRSCPQIYKPPLFTYWYIISLRPGQNMIFSATLSLDWCQCSLITTCHLLLDKIWWLCFFVPTSFMTGSWPAHPSNWTQFIDCSRIRLLATLDSCFTNWWNS